MDFTNVFWGLKYILGFSILDTVKMLHKYHLFHCYCQGPSAHQILKDKNSGRPFLSCDRSERKGQRDPSLLPPWASWPQPLNALGRVGKIFYWSFPWTYICYSILPVLEATLNFPACMLPTYVSVCSFLNQVNRTGWTVSLGWWPTLIIGLCMTFLFIHDK